MKVKPSISPYVVSLDFFTLGLFYVSAVTVFPSLPVWSDPSLRKGFTHLGVHFAQSVVLRVCSSRLLYSFLSQNVCFLNALCSEKPIPSLVYDACYLPTYLQTPGEPHSSLTLLVWLPCFSDIWCSLPLLSTPVLCPVLSYPVWLSIWTTFSQCKETWLDVGGRGSILPSIMSASVFLHSPACGIPVEYLPATSVQESRCTHPVDG